MEAGQLWRQYVIAAIANVAIISTGYCMGWTSPILEKLQSPEDSPLNDPVTEDQAAWLGSLLAVGAIFGPFVGGFLASRIGRKWALVSSGAPLLLGWALASAPVPVPVELLWAGRVCWGVSAGMVFTVSPMYCAEIATDDSRGALGSYLQTFITFGFLLVYGVGPFVSYHEVLYVGVAVFAAFLIMFIFMPETPTYHLTKNNREAAAACLAKIRGCSISGVQEELDKIDREIKESMKKTATIADVFKGSNFKAFYICCMLVFFQQLCGVNAVLFYMSDIFRAAGSTLDSSISTIIVGGVQVIGSVMTPFVVDRLGRRVLLLISSCGTAIGLGLLGAYFIIAEAENPFIENIRWLPLLSLVLFIVTYCWGLGPLPWAIMSELFPIEVKAVASSMATCFCWILTVLVTRYFSTVAQAVGMYGAFWIFGIFCVCSFFFTLFVVPETKGKSFAEIQEMLGNRSSTKKDEKA